VGRLDALVRDVSVTHAGRPAAWAVRVVLRWVWPLVRVLFRPAIRGLEHLPARGPYLLVANHSAGLGLAELSSFAALYLREVGPERPLAGFAHPRAFGMWPTSVIHPALGVVPSTYAAAEATLAMRVPLLVLPGGDHETMRPITQADRVDLGGRVGFLRIARRAGVAIVPLGIRGSHYTAPILWRSKLLATLLVLPRWVFGVKRWGLSLLAVLGAVGLAMLPLSVPLRLVLMWLWLGSPLVFLPIVPWRVRFAVGAPLDLTWSERPEAEDAEVARALPQVQAELQRLVDGLANDPV
jgi:hypothetical protein